MPDWRRIDGPRCRNLQHQLQHGEYQRIIQGRSLYFRRDRSNPDRNGSLRDDHNADWWLYGRARNLHWNHGCFDSYDHTGNNCPRRVGLLCTGSDNASQSASANGKYHNIVHTDSDLSNPK